MSIIHKVKCDMCGVVAKLKWNGEHWLIPENWVKLFDDSKMHSLDEHICDKCRPKKKPSKTKGKQ